MDRNSFRNEPRQSNDGESHRGRGRSRRDDNSEYHRYQSSQPSPRTDKMPRSAMRRDGPPVDYPSESNVRYSREPGSTSRPKHDGMRKPNHLSSPPPFPKTYVEEEDYEEEDEEEETPWWIPTIYEEDHEGNPLHPVLNIRPREDTDSFDSESGGWGMSQRREDSIRNALEHGQKSHFANENGYIVSRFDKKALIEKDEQRLRLAENGLWFSQAEVEEFLRYRRAMRAVGHVVLPFSKFLEMDREMLEDEEK